MTYAPYPSGYYPPEYIESRPDDPVVSPLTFQLLSRSVTVASNFKQPPDNLSFNVGKNQSLPEDDVTQSVRKHKKRLLPHHTIEQKHPKLLVNENAIRPSMQPAPSSSTTLESKRMPKNPTNQALPNKPRLLPESTKKQPQQQVVQVVEDPQSMDGYWKAGTLFNSQGIVAVGPVVYNENPYAGPFGLNRTGAYIYYIGLCIFVFLAGVFLIMTVIFYTQRYSNSSSNVGNLVGVCICAFAVYLGIQLILVGLWNQRYRREHPKKKIPNKKPRLIYTPYGYYLYPQYFTSVNKETLSRPNIPPTIDSNVRTLPPQKPIERPSPPQKLIERSSPPEPIEIPLSNPEFYHLRTSVDIIHQQPPTDELKTHEKTELTNRTAKTKETTRKVTKDIDKTSKTKKAIKSDDGKPTESSSTARSTHIPVGHRTVILEPYVAPPYENSNVDPNIIGDIKMEAMNVQQSKIKKNRPSSSSSIGNAFYD